MPDEQLLQILQGWKSFFPTQLSALKIPIDNNLGKSNEALKTKSLSEMDALNRPLSQQPVPGVRVIDTALIMKGRLFVYGNDFYNGKIKPLSNTENSLTPELSTEAKVIPPEQITTRVNNEGEIVLGANPPKDITGQVLTAIKIAQMVDLGIQLAWKIDDYAGKSQVTENLEKIPIIGTLANRFGSKKFKEEKLDSATQSTLGNSISGVSLAMEDANLYVGNVSSIDKSKAKKAHKKALELKAKASLLAGNAQDINSRVEGMSDILSNLHYFNAIGGYNMYLRAKEGGKLEETFVYQEAPDDFFLYTEAPKKFAKGGTFNIIPEGALHARKHNIDLEDITKKGIPVVSEDGDGNITQHAEIEHSEIIYRLQVTEALENLLNDYNNDKYTQEQKDLIAIEAGKLIVEETLYNTKDNMNLIQKLT